MRPQNGGQQRAVAVLADQCHHGPMFVYKHGEQDGVVPDQVNGRLGRAGKRPRNGIGLDQLDPQRAKQQPAECDDGRRQQLVKNPALNLQGALRKRLRAGRYNSGRILAGSRENPKTIRAGAAAGDSRGCFIRLA